MRRRSSEEERAEHLQRVTALEKHVVLPVRIALIVSCLVFLWPAIIADIGGKEVGVFKWSTGGYAALTVAYWIYLFLFAAKVQRPAVTQVVIFGSALMDYMFLGVLLNAAIVGSSGGRSLGTGPEASLFWVYCALVVRNTFLFPRPGLQTSTSSLYVLGYVGALLFSRGVFQSRTVSQGEEFSYAEGREIILRVVVLVLVTICSSAIYSLARRRRRELDDAHERAIRSQRLDMAGMLAAQVAHELKNPLSIMNNAAFLLRKASGGQENRVGQQVEIIEEEISRADHIVSELLDFAKLAEGKIEAVLVNDCIDESLASLKRELDTRGINVQRNYSLDLPFLFIDPGQLRQVFGNILLNACEAIQNDGEITVFTRYSRDRVIGVSISDTGKGIPPEVLSEIFKPFFTTKEKGTGMGLSIAQNVVRAYSGEIGAESVPGKGTTFHLRFPTRMAKPVKKQKSPRQASTTKPSLAETSVQTYR